MSSDRKLVWLCVIVGIASLVFFLCLAPGAGDRPHSPATSVSPH